MALTTHAILALLDMQPARATAQPLIVNKSRITADAGSRAKLDMTRNRDTSCIETDDF